MGKSCTEQAKSDVPDRKRVNPVRDEKNRTFRTGNGQILYRTGRTRLSVQEMAKSCTEQAKSDVPDRKRANPVRDEKNRTFRTGKRCNPVRDEKNRTFRTENGQILYRASEIRRSVQEKGESCTRWRCGLANQWRQKNCGTAAGPSRAPFALPLLPISSFHGNKCAQYHVTEGY